MKQCRGTVPSDDTWGGWWPKVDDVAGPKAIRVVHSVEQPVMVEMGIEKSDTEKLADSIDHLASALEAMAEVLKKRAHVPFCDTERGQRKE